MKTFDYADELTELVEDIKTNLNKIKESEVTQFRESIKTFLDSYVEEFKQDLNNTYSETVYNLQNKIKDDNLIINDFEQIMKQKTLKFYSEFETLCQNSQQNTINLIAGEKTRLANFVNSGSRDIQEELQSALYQINKSENFGVKHLEDTYDLGVETIVSAEKTALFNLKKLTEELALKLNETVEKIEQIIAQKIDKALEDIKALEQDAIAHINKVAIKVQSDLEQIKQQYIIEVKKIIEQFELTLSNYTNKLKQELTDHKDKLLKDISIEKELIFIELDKEKNNIIAELNLLKIEIFNKIDQKCKEVLDKLKEAEKNIANLTEQRFIATLPPNQTLIQLPQKYVLNNRVKVFIDGILFFPEGFFEVKLAERQIILKNSYTYETNIAVICDLPDHNIEALKEQLYADGNKFKEQILNDIKIAGREEIKIVDKVVEDGIQKVQDKVDQSVDSIVGTATDKLDKYIQNLIEQKFTITLEPNTTEIQVPKEFVLSSRTRVHIDGELLVPDLQYTLLQREKIIKLKTPIQNRVTAFITDDLPDNNVEALKEQLYAEGNRFKDEVLQDFKVQSNKHKEDIQNKADSCINEIVGNSVNKIDQYITNLIEQKYTTKINTDNKIIQLPEEFVLYQRTRVYLNGQMLVPDEEFTIDYSNNRVEILKEIQSESTVFITDDYPSNDIVELKKVLFEQLNNEKNNAIDKIKSQGVVEITALNKQSVELQNEAKRSIKEFAEKYKEHHVSVKVAPSQNKIIIDKKYLYITEYSKIYFDGVLQELNDTYTVDVLNNTINIIEPFSHPMLATIFNNVKVDTLTQRPATKDEIDSIFK